MLKKAKRFFKEGGKDIKNIFSRFKKRDFSGNAGQAIKNSSYQLTQNIVMKVGSLFFTILLARMLMPKLFGLYSLALSTIVLFGAFSDLGINSALMTFVAKLLGKKDLPKAKAYFKKLLKYKIYLVLFASIILLSLSYFIANNYYNKPIFYALLVGGLYLPISNFLGFLEQTFKATNNFKFPLFKEIIFQILRFTIVPLLIFFLLKSNIETKVLIAIIIFALAFCYFLSLLFLAIFSKKKLKFLSVKEKNLNVKEEKDLKKFILPLSVTALSGLFFGYIDTLMLGHYVNANFIAYYGVAFSLVASASAIIGFVSISFFPLFSKLKGSSLEKLFKKGRNLTFLISLCAGIFTYLVSYFLILLAYGKDYLTAVPILRYFSILVVILPLIGLYGTYLTSQKKTKTIAFLVIASTILNIILNFVFINYGLRFGMFEAVLGACFATIISRFVYLIGLIIWRKK